MGELAEDILQGRCCEQCMSYFEQQSGYPVVCEDCYDEMTDKEKREHQKSLYKEI